MRFSDDPFQRHYQPALLTPPAAKDSEPDKAEDQAALAEAEADAVQPDGDAEAAAGSEADADEAAPSTHGRAKHRSPVCEGGDSDDSDISIGVTPKKPRKAPVPSTLAPTAAPDPGEAEPAPAPAEGSLGRFFARLAQDPLQASRRRPRRAPKHYGQFTDSASP